MKRYVFILYAVLLVFLAACTPKKIVRYYYNEHLRAYNIRTKGGRQAITMKVPRYPDGRKIQSDQDIYGFVERYNAKAFDIPTRHDWDLNKKNKFELARLYYTGLRAYKDRNYKKAVMFFNKAVERNRNIIKYSDIYYLIGKSHYYMEENDKANEYFKKFLEYSESIIHPVLKEQARRGEQRRARPEYELDELFDDAEAHLQEEPEDGGRYLALKYHPEDYYAGYKNRYYKPGFIMGTHGTGGSISVGAAYHADFGFGWYASMYKGINRRFDGQLSLFYGQELRQAQFSLPVKLYADRHERLGIKFVPSFYYIQQRFNQNDKKFWESWVNGSGDISAGFYVNHYWLVYTGYKYFYHNENNPYRFAYGNRKCEVWNYNNFYTGSTFYFYKEIGMTVEYSYKDILAYLDIWFVKAGYNITENVMILSVFGYGFDDSPFGM